MSPAAYYIIFLILFICEIVFMCYMDDIMCSELPVFIKVTLFSMYMIIGIGLFVGFIYLLRKINI